MKTCLSIAGSDPSGGAGIQADLKTFAANGVYGMSVITALTAQNTTGVKDIYTIPADFVKEQLECVFEDIPPDAVKIGMQGDADSIRVICDILSGYKKNTMADAAGPDINAMKIVIDPVMVSTSGHDLINEESYRVLCDYLLPMADIVVCAFHWGIEGSYQVTAGQKAIGLVMDYASAAENWHIAPDNREGVRISFDLNGGSDNGWFLLRLSVHDPVLPLNVESDVEGGVRQMLEALYGVLRDAQGIDLNPLCEAIQS